MKIKLPPFIIADIYKDSLVAYKLSKTKENSINTPEEKKENWYSGENKKHVTVLFKNNEYDYLPEAQFTFLKSILAACKLQLADVALINFIRYTYSYQQLKNLLKPKHVLLFDVATLAIDLPFQVPLYQVQKHDNCSFISAPSLYILSNNNEAAKEEKRKLWTSLKKMFGV